MTYVNRDCELKTLAKGTHQVIDSGDAPAAGEESGDWPECCQLKLVGTKCIIEYAYHMIKLQRISRCTGAVRCGVWLTECGERE